MASPHLFHLHQQTPHNETRAGSRIRGTKKHFPILKGMSLYQLHLQPKGIREPHWHANADELGYCLKGQVIVSLYHTGNVRERFLVKSGDVFFVPSGALHAIENIDAGPSELVLQFSHEEPEDFGLSSAFGMFSDAVLGNTWDVPAATFHALKRSTKDVFAVLRSCPPEIPDSASYASAYRFHLESSAPLIQNEGGSAKVARGDVWPILKRQALYSLLLTKSGMREPHWHPETAELGFVKEGKGRMSILNPDGKVDTYEIQAGDLYFIPKAYPHHIENLTDHNLRLLIFFDRTMPEDIGFTASVRSYSDSILGSVLNTSSDFFKKLPKYYEDLFIVQKINPLDR